MASQTSDSKLIQRTWQFALALFAMPILVGLSWAKAFNFDPYTMTMFPVKTFVEPTANTPWELAFLGLLLIVMGIGLAGWMWKAVKDGRTVFDQVWLAMWFGAMVAVYGASYFVAAANAHDRIAQETIVETGTT